MEENQNATEQLDQLSGAFVESLKRNNKKIRDDRALAIAEDTQMIYKREIEDITLQIKKMRRERENMLDLSPTDAQSLVLASQFDAKKFVADDIDLAVSIRLAEIKLELAQKRYNQLFTSQNN